MKCFYHTDMDGKCAAAIVYWYWKQHVSPKMITTVETFPINYKDDFPFEKIQKDEPVYIVDFSLQKDGDFEKLMEITKAIVWIDHHKTAIEKYEGTPASLLPGLRRNGVSGCELTWEWLFQKSAPPTIVKMLGAYDIWDFRKYGEKLNILQAGIRLFDTRPESFEWVCWLMTDDKQWERIAVIMDKGKVALKYRDNRHASLIQSWSFFTEFEGFKAICCNVGSTSSQLFDSVKEDYDLMMPFIFDGKQWTVSIYTKKDIDCSEIAKKYGGGGHKKAAGFQCAELPFLKR